jgi:hypothetical protein
MQHLVTSPKSATEIVANFLDVVEADRTLKMRYDDLGTKEDVVAFADELGFKFTTDDFVIAMSGPLDLDKIEGAVDIGYRAVQRSCPCLP